MDQAMEIFDRRLLRRRRDRAAARFADYDFLFQEVAERLAERLEEVTRRFPRALDLGGHGGLMAAALGARGGIEILVHADLSPAMARVAAKRGLISLAADEEFLPFAPASFDLIISNLSLHWVNDLPGALLQLRQALKPDGLLLAAMLGGETLKELRQALMQAEIAEEGGVSPRLSPFAEVRDLGGLLQRAGFALPMVDRDRITVSYESPLKLMRDLGGMGEANAVLARRKTLTRRATLLGAAALYESEYADGEGRVPATFEVLTLTGWAPDASQPKPLAPGSAKTRLADALDSQEQPAGEKAGRG